MSAHLPGRPSTRSCNAILAIAARNWSFQTFFLILSRSDIDPSWNNGFVDALHLGLGFNGCSRIVDQFRTGLSKFAESLEAEPVDVSTERPTAGSPQGLHSNYWRRRHAGALLDRKRYGGVNMSSLHSASGSGSPPKGTARCCCLVMMNSASSSASEWPSHKPKES